MVLYAFIAVWIFGILLLGLRPDSEEVAEVWPQEPNGELVRTNNRIINILTLATFIFLWFLTAFRSSSIGNDTSNYIYYIGVFADGLDLSRDFEVGYQLLVYLITRFTVDPHLFLIIMATIMYCGLVVYIFRYSSNPAVSLCLFFSGFFSAYVSMMRQGLAMIIALYGYQRLKEGKKLSAALIFMIAATFHTSAVVCFLLFLNINLLKKKWFVYGMTAFCGLISLTGFVRVFVALAVPRYLHYFQGAWASSGWLAITYLLIVYAVYFYLVSESTDSKDYSDGVIITCFSILLIVTAFGYSMNLFSRIAEYFQLIAVVEIPNVAYRGKVKHFRLILLGICTFLLIMFMVTLILRPGWNHIYPYEFWS